MFPILLLLLAGTTLLQYAVVHVLSATGTHYKYNISGTIYCKENEVLKTPDIKIELREKDWNNDDELGTTYTDAEGHFEGLFGEEDEGNPPEPYILVFRNKCKPLTITKVMVPATPVRQKLSIYLGTRKAVLHQEGGVDLPLTVDWHNM